MGSGADEKGRGWWVAVAALGAVTIAAYGVAYYSYGVLIDPIHAQTGWSSAALGAIFSAVLVISGAGGLAGGRLVDRLGTRPAFLLAGTVGAGAVALASYQHDLELFAPSYAAGCGVIAALGFYHVTQPAAIRAAGAAPERAVVWLTIFGAFASPTFLPLTAVLVDGIGWRATIRVLAAIAAAIFLPTAALGRSGAPAGPAAHPPVGVADALRDAWHTPGFPRWVLASLIGGAAVDVILVYQVPVMIAAGLPIGAAATIGGIRGFAQLGGRIPLAPLLQRLGTRRSWGRLRYPPTAPDGGRGPHGQTRGAHLRATGVVQADKQDARHQNPIAGAGRPASRASSLSAAVPIGGSGCQPTSHVPRADSRSTRAM
jgi:MFS family permease